MAAGAVRRWRRGDDPGPLRQLLRRGGVAAIPTESSYGLAVDPRDRQAVARIYRIKGREEGKPLPVVAAGPEQLGPLGISLTGAQLGGLEQLWPAALSILFDVGDGVAAAAGTGKLAVRVPDFPELRDLLRDLEMPLTATSANRSGEPAITDPAALEELLAGEEAVIVDGGRLPGGPPSTLVAVEAGVVTILRPGRVSAAELRRAAPGLEVRRSFSAAAVEIPVEESR